MDTRRRNYGSQQMYSFFVKKLGISTHISSVIELKILSLAQSGRISTERLRIMAELDCKLEKMSKVEKFFENQSIRKQFFELPLVSSSRQNRNLFKQTRAAGHDRDFQGNVEGWKTRIHSLCVSMLNLFL
ncbi:uncharacterized protein [Bemisia tabaci]|uniref:uncharacterized protein isoform X3 n=1 Tax=Bemisia tabaci TaxID=7038 RepID=UPI003B287D78